jgi:hypothetical protein
VYEADAANGLSWEKVVHEIDINHPRRIDYRYDGTDSYEKWPICLTSFGWFSPDPEIRRTVMGEYGVGTVLYFQFVKHMTCVFLMLSILSLPSMLIYYSGNTAFSWDL